MSAVLALDRAWRGLAGEVTGRAAMSEEEVRSTRVVERCMVIKSLGLVDKSPDCLRSVAARLLARRLLFIYCLRWSLNLCSSSGLRYDHNTTTLLGPTDMGTT